MGQHASTDRGQVPDDRRGRKRPRPIRALALRVRACETGEPWPEAELDEARHTWPLRELVLLVHVLEGQVCGWECDLRLEIAEAYRARDERRLMASRPGCPSLLDQFGQASRRQGQLGAWRRALEAAATD